MVGIILTRKQTELESRQLLQLPFDGYGQNVLLWVNARLDACSSCLNSTDRLPLVVRVRFALCIRERAVFIEA